MSNLMHQVYLGATRDEIFYKFSSEMSSFSNHFGNNYMLWDEDSISSLIKKVYGDDTLNAFYSLKPMSYRADLARYCILDTFGGWYSDLGSTLANIPNVDDIDMVVFRETNEMLGTYWIAIGLMYSKKNNQVFKNVIKKICDNVNTSNYGTSPWAITGNQVLGSEFAKYEVDNEVKFLAGDFIRNPDTKLFQYVADQVGIVAYYKDQSDPKKDLSSGYHYMDMWKNRDVFI